MENKNINGKVQRASYDVKENDVIEVKMGERLIRVQVVSVLEYAKKENAGDMYKLL